MAKNKSSDDPMQGDLSLHRTYQKSVEGADATHKLNSAKLRDVEKTIMEKLPDGAHYVRFDNGVICRVFVFKMGERGVRQMTTEWSYPTKETDER